MSGGDWKDLYAAATAGDLPRVAYRLKEGVNPNYQHPEIMCTPLVASIAAGHDAVALHLLAHGADPALESDCDQLTPTEAARRHGRAAVLAELHRLAPRRPRGRFWRRWLGV